MKQYEYDVDVTITYVKTVSVEAVDEDQAEYLAHAEMRKEFGVNCDIEIRRTYCTGVVQDERRYKERHD